MKKSVPKGIGVLSVNKATVILVLALLFDVRASVASAQSGERVYSTAADSIFVLRMSDPAGKTVGTATGFLVAENLLLTNAHVANAGSISVRMGSLQVPCVTKRVDDWNDLALCEMAAKSSAAPIRFAATEASPGATVYALGNPQGLEKTISQGLFTGVREVDGRRVAQVSAAISSGSSGGPILNSDGELVGVAVFYLKDGQALNFAVPLDIVRDFVAGKAPSASDYTSLLTVVKGLLLQRKGVNYKDPKAKELDTEIHDSLIRVVSGTNDLAVLDQVRELAGWWRSDIQVAVARKVLSVTKVPTAEMYANLATALSRTVTEIGPSPVLDEAEKAAARAVALGGGRAEDLLLLGSIQTDANKTEQAYAILLKAWKLAKPGTDLANSVSRQLFYTTSSMGNSAEAISWFKKAERSGSDLSIYAGYLDGLSRYDEAAAAWMSAFAKEPYTGFLCNASESYRFANNLDQALATARRCLEEASKYDFLTRQVLQAHKVLSSVLTARGVYEEGANHARQAIAIAVDDPWAHYYLAEALLELRRLSEAVSSARAAIRLSDGKYGTMHFILGGAHFELKQWPEAVQAFTKAAELSPTDAVSAYNVAVSYYNSQYYSDALWWYREALRRDPNSEKKAHIQSMIARLSVR